MIKNAIKYSPISVGVVIATLFSVIAVISLVFMSHASARSSGNTEEKLVTIHDRNQERVILTRADSVKSALEEAGITLDGSDTVEPSLNEELISSSYHVNIYRARPVIVVDGMVRQKVMTAYQTAEKIAEDADIELFDEDEAVLKPAEDIVSDGAGLELNIDRATQFTLVLYGKRTDVRTQSATVRDMFEDKNITPGADDHVSVPLDTRITANMTVALWRNGKQTVTEEKDVPFETEKVYDAARPVGFREIRTPGVLGKRAVTYEVDMQVGKETARREIQNVITKEPKKQVEVVGLNPANGLSKSKGAHVFKDSNGVAHRETYYDLPMRVVMGACGAGGQYTVRPDGVKVDKDGYVIIAANLGNYPRCSVVETSLGPGKVYDTGGFAARHPHGFDLATDWTNNDGR